MPVNQTFGKWEVVTDTPGEDIVFEHAETPGEVRFAADGTVTTTSPKGGGLTEGATITAADSPFSASAGYQYVIDASGGAVTVDLPADPADRDTVEFTVVNAGSNDVTIGRNENTIEGTAADDTVTSSYVTRPYEWIAEADGGAGSWVIVT